MNRFLSCVLCVLAGCMGCGTKTAELPQKTAEPPSARPGSFDYAHRTVRETEVGSGGEMAWVYEPGDPAPEEAPIVVFLHGWGAAWPVVYRNWIDHIVRRGNIVIYPRYQGSFVTLPGGMTENAEAGIKNALAELKKAGHVKFDGKKCAVAGHSLGAVIAANIAAEPDGTDLPQPLALMCVQPGDPERLRYVPSSASPFKDIMADYPKIPKGTLVLVVVGDADLIVGDVAAKAIWDGIAHLPAKDRDYVTVESDFHGSPGLRADHVFPVAPETGSLMEWTGVVRTDALDYYGTWKLLDGLIDAAFYGRHREYALGNTPEQRYMGKWPDGTPVKELEVLEK